MSEQNNGAFIPDEAIHVPEGQEVPEGYVPLKDALDEKFKGTIAEQRKRLQELNGVNILGVSAEDAKQLAKELMEAAPEHITKLVAAASYLLLNQSDVVDRIGLAVQDSVVFMNDHTGQLNTRNYVLSETPNQWTNMRMEYNGRTGDLTKDDQIYGYSYRIMVPANQEEFDAGPDSYSVALPLPRSTHYHLTYQLVMLQAGIEKRNYYLAYSQDMQDPFLAPVRALEGLNPAINKDVKGHLKTNIHV